MGFGKKLSKNQDDFNIIDDNRSAWDREVEKGNQLNPKSEVRLQLVLSWPDSMKTAIQPT
jgi:hypothetical protein